MCEACQQVIENLSINIELFFSDLDILDDRKKLNQLDKQIICYSLLGLYRKEIAHLVKLPDQKIRDQLTNNIYPRIADLMGLDQGNRSEGSEGNTVRLWQKKVK